jgi:hypothetical protein
VHALLRHLEGCGFDAAPRVLGIDDRGREMLTYIEGETVGVDDPWPAWWRADDTLVHAVTLLRRFHEAAASFEPPPGARWRLEGRIGSGATIVHGDWAPYNVVWREGRVVGVIDWDLARPGDALDDLAFAAWHWAPLHHPGMLDGGALGRWRREDRERRLRLVLDTYGLEDRESFITRVIARITASADGIERAAADGDVGMIGLRELGVVGDIRRSASWVRDHRTALAAAVGARPGSM